MRKIIRSILVILCAAALLFTGCSSGVGQVDDDAAAKTTTKASTSHKKTKAPEKDDVIQFTQEQGIETAVAPDNPPTRKITITSDLVYRRNQYATLSINAKPGIEYEITVYYNSGPSTAEGLEPKVADADGNVSWTWKVGGRTAEGTYRITIEGGGEMIEREITVITD